MPDTRTIAVLALIVGAAALIAAIWHAVTPVPPAHPGSQLAE